MPSLSIFSPATEFENNINISLALNENKGRKTCTFIKSMKDLQTHNNKPMDLSEPRILGAQLEAEGEIKNSKEIVQMWYEMIDQLYIVTERTWVLAGKSNWEFDLLFEEYKDLSYKKKSKYGSSPERLSSKILKVTRGLSNYTKELIPNINQASQILQDIKHRGTLSWIFKQIVGEKWLERRKNELHLIGNSLGYTQQLTIFLHNIRTTVHLFQENILTLQNLIAARSSLDRTTKDMGWMIFLDSLFLNYEEKEVSNVHCPVNMPIE
ncbi:hypothetical protein BY996DRAFT_6411328 [Phakopsora pachyrhizi]|nr:hypothetical protein BY996DRAFT_6424068 [Phakopsora pachyrhizi]KAI8457890.1 hypothetical protein BY996DRAFT_6411328 [Phakopsora pachyrhizi]